MLMRIDRHRRALRIADHVASCVSAENEFGGASSNHVGRRVRGPRDDMWHHRRVSYAQTLKTVYAKLWVDNCEFIHADFACANSMSEACRGQSGQLADVLGRRPGARHHLGLPHAIKSMLTSKFARDFNGANDGRKI